MPRSAAAARNLEFAGEAILNRAYRTAGAQMGMADRLLDRQNRRGGHRVLLHMGDGTIAIGESGEPVFDQLDHIGTIREPSRVRAQLGIIHQLRPAHRLAEVLPMMQEGHNHDPSAGRFEYPGWREIVEMRSLAARLELTLTAAELMNADLVTVVVNVEQDR
jgi:hypothetical protein